MDEVTLAYLAGLLDADGYFTIKRNTYHVRIRGDARCPMFNERIGLKQTRPEGVALLHSLFGGYRNIQRGYSRHTKLLHGWQVTDAAAAKVAQAMLPFLRLKRQQAGLIIALRRHKGLGRMRLRQPDGTTFPWRHWTGKTIQMRRFVMRPEAVAYRQALFERVKTLNDTRPRQAKLG
ncbi:MAG: hypothetical protein ACE5IZ_01190 [Dehalococcoidia bacterium]